MSSLLKQFFFFFGLFITYNLAYIIVSAMIFLCLVPVWFIFFAS